MPSSGSWRIGDQQWCRKSARFLRQVLCFSWWRWLIRWWRWWLWWWWWCCCCCCVCVVQCEMLICNGVDSVRCTWKKNEKNQQIFKKATKKKLNLYHSTWIMDEREREGTVHPTGEMVGPTMHTACLSPSR